MLATAIPTKFPIIWGTSAVYIRTIPTTSQIGVNAGFASLPDGFVPLNQTPVSAGGIPPFIQDMNGILNEITANDQWAQAGGQWVYDGTFSTAIGGYPKNAVLASTTLGNFWRSTADSNTTDPDGGGAANWVNFFAPVFISPTFSGTATFAGGTTIDGSGNVTARSFLNFGISFLTPSVAILSMENAFGLAAQFCYSGTNSAVAGAAIRLQSTSPQYLQFQYQGVETGAVVPSGTTAVSYTSISDARRKTKKSVYDPGDIFDRMEFWNFTWDTGEDSFGVMAQELFEIAPYLVRQGDNGSNRKVGDEGFRAWSTSMSKPLTMAFAEIKSLRERQAKIEAMLEEMQTKRNRARS